MVTKRQARTNIARLQAGLDYRGEASGARQTYYVFEASDCYFVLSFAPAESTRGSGYFTVVDNAVVDYVRKRFAGEKKITAKDLVRGARRTRHIPNNLLALNIFYVLVALGEAKIVGEGPNRQLLFSIL
ncbi:MAG: hypothetical protein ACREQZ_03980 [Woeseiaceae bacterium]